MHIHQLVHSAGPHVGSWLHAPPNGERLVRAVEDIFPPSLQVKWFMDLAVPPDEPLAREVQLVLPPRFRLWTHGGTKPVMAIRQDGGGEETRKKMSHWETTPASSSALHSRWCAALWCSWQKRPHLPTVATTKLLRGERSPLP